MLLNTSDPDLSKNSESIFMSFQKKKKPNVANGVFHKHAKKSTSNALYFELHKNDKGGDLIMHIFKSRNFIRYKPLATFKIFYFFQNL